jgi:hypothetical protein
MQDAQASFPNAGPSKWSTVEVVGSELTPSQIALLSEIVQRRDNGSPLLDALRRGPLRDEEAHVVAGLVTLELAERGFDADYKPTALGRELEDIIDVLNPT